jgi:hypothetical protein
VLSALLGVLLVVWVGFAFYLAGQDETASTKEWLLVNLLCLAWPLLVVMELWNFRHKLFTGRRGRNG